MASTETPSSASAVKQFSTFLPLTLFGLALIILLGNEIITLKADIGAAEGVLVERAEATTKAQQHYRRLEQLIGDIVELGKSDEAAARIAHAYNLNARVQAAGQTQAQPPTAESE